MNCEACQLDHSEIDNPPVVSPAPREQPVRTYGPAEEARLELLNERDYPDLQGGDA